MPTLFVPLLLCQTLAVIIKMEQIKKIAAEHEQVTKKPLQNCSGFLISKKIKKNCPFSIKKTD